MRARPVIALALLLAPAAALAAPNPHDLFTCPAGQQPTMSVGDFEALAAAYRSGELDPLPKGTVEKPLPKVYFIREALEDPSFPPSGRANAVLLLRENGSVARVLVPCTSSYKLVEPIVAALSKARLDPATSKGVPVKSMIVVPIAFGD